jgi:glutathione S-transferase
VQPAWWRSRGSVCLRSLCAAPFACRFTAAARMIGLTDMGVSPASRYIGSRGCAASGLVAGAARGPLLSSTADIDEEAPMKLYYSPGASSLAPHIALREAGLRFDLERVSLKTKKTASDADFTRINPKGYVPTLQFEDGTVLTEGPAIMLWIGDQVPEKRLVPSPGTMERYHLVECLNFIATELHKNLSALFDPAAPDASKAAARAKLEKRLDYLNKALGDAPFMLGEHFTVADAYLFTVLGWGKFVDIDLARWPKLAAYAGRIGVRPKVLDTLRAEGLLKS